MVAEAEKRKSSAGVLPSKKRKSNTRVGGSVREAELATDSGAAPILAKREKQREKRTGLQEAISKWEKLRRHDTDSKERADLVGVVLGQIKGRVGDVATSPTGSRVLQACAKYGTPAERASLLASIVPRIVELSKSPYAHFLVTKLISSASKAELEGILKAYKGHVATLLRHPAGAAVIDELYNAISAPQRNSLAAEFYGREYTLLTQSTPSRLRELLSRVDAPKRRTILQRMAVHLIPIMEKGLVDPVIVHRLLAEYVEAAAPSARADALEMLAGDALLRMVHTRDGAWLAATLLRYGTAKDCKKAVKAMKGHVEIMAKDVWGSLVLAAALSHVDDTVLLRKVIVPPILAKLEELCRDKHARLVLLQLLAPDKARYLPAELLSVVNPTVPEIAALPASSAPGLDKGANDAEAQNEDRVGGGTEGTEAVGLRKKAPAVRRAELLGQGPTSIAGSLLRLCTDNTAAMLCSQTGSNLVVELAAGSSGGIVQRHHAQEVAELQAAIVKEADKPFKADKHVATNVFGSRALRRLVLASREDEDYDNIAPKQMRDALWDSFKERCDQCKGSHAQKVLDAFLVCGLKAG